DGPTTELLDRTDILRSVFLEGAAAAMGAEEEGLVGGATGPGDGGTKAGAGLQLKPFEIPTDRKGRPRPPVLAVTDLAVSFGGIKAVDGVDLAVYEGQVV